MIRVYHVPVYEDSLWDLEKAICSHLGCSIPQNRYFTSERTMDGAWDLYERLRRSRFCCITIDSDYCYTQGLSLHHGIYLTEENRGRVIDSEAAKEHLPSISFDVADGKIQHLIGWAFVWANGIEVNGVKLSDGFNSFKKLGLSAKEFSPKVCLDSSRRKMNRRSFVSLLREDLKVLYDLADKYGGRLEVEHIESILRSVEPLYFDLCISKEKEGEELTEEDKEAWKVFCDKILSNEIPSTYFSRYMARVMHKLLEESNN